MMKSIKWKSLIITSLVCLLPIFFGVFLWDKLPDRIAIHFNFYGEPDNFSSKAFAVFGLPLMMAFFQVICSVAYDMKITKQHKIINIEKGVIWILPVISIVLQAATLGFAMGLNIDMGKVAAILLVFLLSYSIISIYTAKKSKKGNF